MPPSPARAIEAERLARRTGELLAQGLERSQIMARLGISKGHATRLIAAARSHTQ